MKKISYYEFLKELGVPEDILDDEHWDGALGSLNLHKEHTFECLIPYFKGENLDLKVILSLQYVARLREITERFETHIPNIFDCAKTYVGDVRQQVRNKAAQEYVDELAANAPPSCSRNGSISQTKVEKEAGPTTNRIGELIALYKSLRAMWQGDKEDCCSFHAALAEYLDLVGKKLGNVGKVKQSDIERIVGFLLQSDTDSNYVSGERLLRFEEACRLLQRELRLDSYRSIGFPPDRQRHDQANCLRKIAHSNPVKDLHSSFSHNLSESQNNEITQIAILLLGRVRMLAGEYYSQPQSARSPREETGFGDTQEMIRVRDIFQIFQNELCHVFEYEHPWFFPRAMADELDIAALFSDE